MSAQANGRRTFIKESSLAILGISSFAGNASAAKYFGDKTDYPEVIQPKNAVKNEELYDSSATKSAVSNIKEYRSAILELQDKLSKDPQADLRTALKERLSYSKLRNDLNTAGSAFEEDSQRGLDRITRIILQDIVEFEEASKFKKDGSLRNERRITSMKAKLKKLEQAFDEMLSYF
eukprot:CAMPEP_0171451742 /NCGR_PEP_ID=MMETSP0945-20130129/120_1 /TAXON_ID=109269 /ORGANISM="Vaucheria litorea, Strain CCMP2940" /LENGTH=176 /DNA_ID=CAMNT_0011976253 /DNA_START=129 /DNA_END=659 /DNA_ORIENTATION=+